MTLCIPKVSFFFFFSSAFAFLVPVRQPRQTSFPVGLAPPVWDS